MKPEHVPETGKRSGNQKSRNLKTIRKLEKFPHHIPETRKHSRTCFGNLKISITPPRTRNMSEKQEHVPETRKISVPLSSKLEKNVLIILDTVHD